MWRYKFRESIIKGFKIIITYVVEIFKLTQRLIEDKTCQAS